MKYLFVQIKEEIKKQQNKEGKKQRKTKTK